MYNRRLKKLNELQQPQNYNIIINGTKYDLDQSHWQKFPYLSRNIGNSITIKIDDYNEFLEQRHINLVLTGTDNNFLDIIDYKVICRIYKYLECSQYKQFDFAEYANTMVGRNDKLSCRAYILYKFIKPHLISKIFKKEFKQCYADYLLFFMTKDGIEFMKNLSREQLQIIYGIKCDMVNKYRQLIRLADRNEGSIQYYDHMKLYLDEIEETVYYKPMPANKITVPNNKFLSQFKRGDRVLEWSKDFNEKIQKFTMGIFSGMNWRNVIYSGSPLSILANPNCKPEDINIQSDLDLFIYGDSEAIRLEKIKYLLKFFKSKFGDDLFVSFAGYAITLFIRSKENRAVYTSDKQIKADDGTGLLIYRNIQLINTGYTNPLEIIINFDISTTQIYYQYDRVVVTRKFLKYYESMCAKVLSTLPLEYRLSKTYKNGFSLIRNNRLSITDDSDRFCHIYHGFSFDRVSLDNEHYSRKMNKYYYPVPSESDDRVMYCISCIFNIPLRMIYKSKDIAKMLWYVTHKLSYKPTSVNKQSTYIKNEVNTVGKLVSTMKQRIVADGPGRFSIGISRNKPISIRLPDMRIIGIRPYHHDDWYIISYRYDKVARKVVNGIGVFENKILKNTSLKKIEKLMPLPAFKINPYKNTLDLYVKSVPKHPYIVSLTGLHYSDKYYSFIYT